MSRVHFVPRPRVRSFEQGRPYCIKHSILVLAFAASLLAPGRLLGQQMVGVARVDITPDYPIRLNGFGFRRAESEGVRQPIWAKALAIGSDDTAGGPAILIVIDTLGIPDTMTRDLAQRLLPLGIQPDRLAIMTTHTHTGPMIQQVAPTIFGQPIPPNHQQHIDRYTKEFSERLFAVSQAALKDRRPAKIRWGNGRVGFAANRRTAGGPVDHDLPMLAVYDEQGALRAVWTTYACHCVTLSENLIGGDWAGYAQSHIERLFPGCTAMVSIGCGADANPASGVTGDKADVAESQGLEIAREVRRLLEHPLTEITKPLTTKLQRIELPLAPLPSRDVWQERAAMTDAIGYHAKVQLARLDRGEKLLSSIEYPVQTWTFGDQLAMIFLPGEVVVDYAIRLKSEQDGSRIWINGYANHCPGYVPSERILREGGYEGGGAMVYYDIPGPYAKGVEQKIVSEVQKQLGDAFQRRKPAQGTQGRLPLPPNEALASLKTHDGLQVELVASEPLVTSPVAIAFGLDGRLWVAEMYDYPTGLDGNFGKGGRVKVLRDTNHDGRMDDATVFLDSIPFPTGITVWRDGVLVCAAPDILFARDTNGDGRADEVQRLYHGFGTDNYQARVNSLEYGLDGWVYGSCGLFGGSIETITGETIALGDRDFRIRPDAGLMEPASGRTQQGRVRNDRGDWFGCDNSNLVYHYPLLDHDLRRNPYLIATETLVHLAPGEAGATLYPISQQVLFKLSGPAGRITAGCGLGIYRDNYLGPQYTGNAFTCEPVNNLVHRQVIQPDGVTYRGHRASDEADREFLSSADPWFRPVQARTGPDGGLWVVDMYRYVIEHPRWIPPESLDQLDVRAGADFGRIYRVVRRDASLRPAINLNQATPSELVSVLDSPNGTLRDLATQQLIWTCTPPSAEVTSALSRFLHSNAHEWTRLHALTALDQLNSLTIDQVSAAMQDSASTVRRQAVRLAADPRYVSPALQAALQRLEKDPSAEVRQEVAVSLGNYPTNAAATTLGRLLLADDNTISRTAALSSLSAINLVTVVKTVLATFQVDQHLTLATDLFTIAGAMNDEPAITELVDWIDHSTQLDNLSRQHLWTGFFSGRQRANLAAAGLPADVMKAAGRQLTIAREVANQESAATPLRESAIRLLGEADLERDANRQALFQLLAARASAELADASVRALESQSDDQTAEHLLMALADASPKASEVLIGSLLTRGHWTQMLLEAIESDKLPRSLLGATEQARLRESEDESIRARAAKLFEDQPVTGLADLNEYLLAAKKGGDADRGREVFARQCASCHRWQETGQTVGPDLASYTQKPLEALLVAVLDPNQAIDPRYVNYNLTTTDGRVFSGIIQQETATSLTLADGKREATTLARTQIDYLQRTGLSLMPAGLAREITPAAMADLIEFLMGSGSALGTPIPGND